MTRKPRNIVLVDLPKHLKEDLKEQAKRHSLSMSSIIIAGTIPIVERLKAQTPAIERKGE